jgi:hypothetical protein
MPRTDLAQQVIAALLRRLADPVTEVADAALESLLEYGDLAVPGVLTALGDLDPDRAVRAGMFLGRLPGLVLADPAVLAGLQQALAAEDGAVRATAARQRAEPRRDARRARSGTRIATGAAGDAGPAVCGLP